MRSILIFPEMYNYHEIQEIRTKYDPLAQNIAPHISLVFPFASEMSNEELFQKVTAKLTGIKSFPVTFDHLGSDDNGYIWLEAHHGKDRLIKLHDLLYSDESLEPFLRSDIPYVPHITLGQVPAVQQAELLAELPIKQLTFSTYIDQVKIENILFNNDSEIIFQQELN